MSVFYEAKSMPYARHLREEMIYGFLIAHVRTIFVMSESFLVLTPHQTVQY